MIKNYRNNLPFFEFHSLQKFSDDVTHAVLSRRGGVSKPPFDSLNISFEVNDDANDVLQNRALVSDAFKIPKNLIISGNQTHGKNVKIIDELSLQKLRPNEEINNVDAFISNLPGVALMIKVADCQAILLLDPVQKVVAAIHAGWRGLMQDISGTAISLMKTVFRVNPENLRIGIAPSLGPCCSYFSNPDKELSADFKPYIQYNNTVDLWKFSTDQLVKHGIRPEHIEHARICTMCGGGGKFYSFRRDLGVTGRFGAMIFLNEKKSLSQDRS